MTEADSNPPVLTAEELRALGHPAPELGEGLSKLGFETRPGHTWTSPALEQKRKCDRAASRSLRNVEHFIRNRDLADAEHEIHRVIRMVELLENERGVHCACEMSAPEQIEPGMPSAVTPEAASPTRRTES